MLKKNSEPNRIYRLIELEKITEDIDSLGGLCKNVNELIRIKIKRKELGDNENKPLKLIKDLSSHSLSKFKVSKNEQTDQTRTPKFKNEQDGRPQKSYQIIIDAKYVKIIVKRSYRAENLYDFFRNLYQIMNSTFLEFESLLVKHREKFDPRLMNRKLNLSQFGPQSMNKQISKHKNRACYVKKYMIRYTSVPT